MRRSCETVIKDIHSLRKYKIFNSLYNRYEKPYFGMMILLALKLICRNLLKDDICTHFKNKCEKNCKQYAINGNFKFFFLFLK